MPRPLADRRNSANLFASGNHGLLWNKFFDGWGQDFNEPAGGPAKQAWIKKFTGSAGDEDALKKAGERMQALTKALGGNCQAYTTIAPFVTGLGLEHPVENGFAWHHTLGVPCLPASSVKGLVRAWAENWLECKAEVARIFGGPGDAEGVGSVIVFDALPTGPVTLMAEVLTPHDGGWRQGNAPAPSDWHSPTPIPFLVVAPGARFCFAAAPRPGAKSGREDAELFMGWLKEALDWIGAGAKTAVGFGRFLEDEALRNLEREMEAQQKAAEKERAEAERNAPPKVGDKMRHDEWGLVEIRRIEGANAVVYSIDEAEEVELPLSELKRP